MKALKTFLVWILLLALPVQGFAAVSMAMCDSGKVAIPASGAGTQDDGDCGHHMAAQSADEPGSSCDSPSAMSKCSTCASCSVGAAIVAIFPSLPQFSSHGAEPIPYVAAHDTACIPGTLEKPPHTHSA